VPHASIAGVSAGLTELVRLPPELVGHTGRGATGKRFSTVRATKERWRGRTAPLTQAEAHAWRGLLQGEGQHWSFNTLDSYLSDAGLADTSSSGTFSLSTSGPKHGSAFLYSQSVGAWKEWAGVLPASSPWTTMLWRADGPFPAGFRHWITTSAGGNWVDAVTSAVASAVQVSGGAVRIWGRQALDGYAQIARSTAYVIGDVRWEVGTPIGLLYRYVATTNGTTGASVPAGGFGDDYDELTVDGTVTWRNDGRAGILADDLVVLPFVVPDSWVTELRAEHNARPWALPGLRLAGDVVAQLPGAAATVRGRMGAARTLIGAPSGSLSTTLEELELELREV
jgi:hypothetical protein